MATAFISYSHTDEVLKDRFLQHLAPFRREGLIAVWHDRMLRAGDHLDENIQRELASSDLVILLVSAAFLNSEYCYEEEMQRAFVRQRAGNAKVVVVILRPCQWKNVPVGDGQTLSSFLAVPKDGRAITSWPNLDEAFDDAAGAIRTLLLEQVKAPPISQPRSDIGGVAKKPPSQPQSIEWGESGLSLRPRVTDRDRDRYLKDSFEQAAATFQNRLAGLSSDPRVEGDFERVDSRTFVARVYIDGDKAGECRISSDSEHFRNSLSLSFDLNSRNSTNEWLSIDTTDGILGFKSSGMGFGRGADTLLDQNEAADHLWGVFFDHIKSRSR
jgi:hypothetical protein